MVATTTREGPRPFGAESEGQDPLSLHQPAPQRPRESQTRWECETGWESQIGWEMQTTGTTAPRDPMAAVPNPPAGAPGPDPLAHAGAATAIPESPKGIAGLWANPKFRHALVVVAGIVVVGVGVVLALLSGGGTPPAEELGASLSQAYSAFHSTSPTSNGPGSTTTSPTTTPAAQSPVPVGDVATSAATSKSSAAHKPTQSEDNNPPGSLPAPVCPGTSPDCGPFRWDATPAPNTPQHDPVWTASVAPGPDNRIHLVAGQALSVSVSAEDPDAEFPSCWITVASPGGTLDPIQCTQDAKVLYPGEYGAHPVPAPVHGKAGPISVNVVYTGVGDHDLTITTTSGLYAQCGVASAVNCNPFGDSATVTIPITVSAS